MEYPATSDQRRSPSATGDARSWSRVGVADVDPVTLARHGLIVLAALIPLQRATVIEDLGSLVSLVAVAVIPLALWAEWGVRRSRRPLTATPLAFAVVLGWWAGAGYFWSVDPAVTASSFYRLLPIIALAVAFFALSSVAAFRQRLLGAYVLGSVVASALVIWQFLTTPAGERFSVSADASINQVAFTLALALIPAAYLLARALRPATPDRGATPRWPVLLHGSSYSLITTAVILSGSRSAALLSVLATLVALALIGSAATNVGDALKAVAAMVVVGVVLVSTFSLSDAPPLERLMPQDGQGLEEEARAGLLARAWTESAEQPILGAGLGTGVSVPLPGDTHDSRNPHNTHMQVFLELGAVGTVLWAFLIVAVFRAALRRPPLERLMWLGQLAVLFIGIGARGFIFGVPLWFFLGMASAPDDAPSG